MTRTVFVAMFFLFLAEGCASTPLLSDNKVEEKTGVAATKTFKYFEYYRKIRAKLQQAWADEIRARVAKDKERGEKSFPLGEQTAKFVFTIGPGGELKSVKLLEPSENLALDETVVRAVKRAAPFDAPPAALLDPKTGVAEIRWDFVVQN